MWLNCDRPWRKRCLESTLALEAHDYLERQLELVRDLRAERN